MAIDLRDPSVFDFIYQHGLEFKLTYYLLALLEIDPARTVEYLLRKTDFEVTERRIDKCVRVLIERSTNDAFMFLHQLFK